MSISDETKNLNEDAINDGMLKELNCEENAITMAINECIDNNILKDFLTKNKQDVINACLFEYIVGKHMDKADDAESEESE